MLYFKILLVAQIFLFVLKISGTETALMSEVLSFIRQVKDISFPYFTIEFRISGYYVPSLKILPNNFSKLVLS